MIPLLLQDPSLLLLELPLHFLHLHPVVIIPLVAHSLLLLDLTLQHFHLILQLSQLLLLYHLLPLYRVEQLLLKLPLLFHYCLLKVTDKFSLLG